MVCYRVIAAPDVGSAVLYWHAHPYTVDDDSELPIVYELSSHLTVPHLLSDHKIKRFTSNTLYSFLVYVKMKSD